jgi:arylsulfatase
MDPHEDLNVTGLFAWVGEPALEIVKKYKETLQKFPNPPGANLTRF